MFDSLGISNEVFELFYSIIMYFASFFGVGYFLFREKYLSQKYETSHILCLSLVSGMTLWSFAVWLVKDFGWLNNSFSYLLAIIGT